MGVPFAAIKARLGGRLRSELVGRDLLTCIDNLAKKCFVVKVSQIHLPFHKLIFYSFRGWLNVNPNSSL